MPRTLAVSTALLWLALAACSTAQTPGFPPATQRSFTELKTLVARGDASDSQTIQLRWFAIEGAAQPASDVTVLSRRRGTGPLPRERDPQLSADRLVVISVDATGRELDWRIVPDPRLVRAEFPDAQGRLSGRAFQRTEVNLLVDVPNDPDIVRLRIYAPQLTNDGFILNLLTTVDLQ
ncbi:MAG: hypothetical protein HY047_02690 [Acidobacteria bacterium]|nr:hypothetical protein [Acidobacteriota bacterium]